MATHKQGTATVTNGSATVTGNGTAWAVSAVAGGIFSRGGVSIPIASVESDSSLTLDYAWPAGTGSGAYSISYVGALGLAAAAIQRLNENIERLRGLSALGRQLTSAETAAAMRGVLEAIGPEGGSVRAIGFGAGTVLQDETSGNLERAYWRIAGDRLELVNEANNQHIAIFDLANGPSWRGAHKMWHAGNDGDGSGLDADVLDGQHGSYYRDFANMSGSVQPGQQVLRPDVQGGIGSFCAGIYADAPKASQTVGNAYPGTKIDDPAVRGNRYFGGLWRIVGFVGFLSGGDAIHIWQRYS